MINKAIDNELRISYKDGGNAYDMGGQLFLKHSFKTYPTTVWFKVFSHSSNGMS